MVKFCHDLTNERIDKWKSHYIDYKKLKKIINKNNLSNNNINDIFKKFDKTLYEELDNIENFYIKSTKNLYNRLLENKNSEKDHSIYFIEADEYRQYILLNTIAIIKIIKKRNKKNNNNQLNILDTLIKYDFYHAKQLVTIFSYISQLNKNYLSNHLQNILNNINILTSVKFLNNIKNKQIDFHDYNMIPIYDSANWTDTDFEKYLDNKLGYNISIKKITNKNNLRANRIDILDLPVVNNKNSNLRCSIRLFLLIIFLYLFLFGLVLMGNSFKAMNGKNVGPLFSAIENPIAGIMVGILSTILLQSSSTTTSIIVSMGGAMIMSVKTAIPIIMGANIGTSITNTLVSYGHINNNEEFEKAFTGATIHDIFNLLSVLVLLPIELISGLFGYPILYSITDTLVKNLNNIYGKKFESPINIIINPLSELFIKINKDIIKAVATGCQSCSNTNSTIINITSTNNCLDIKGINCITRTVWEDKYLNGRLIESGILNGVDDIGGGIIGLVISLFTLTVSLYYIVKILQRMVLHGNGQTRFFLLLKKVLTYNGYISILFGLLLTVAVQSSSIITSTLTPLVGLSIITVEQMLPLTLGSNIGTTCTAIIAGFVSNSTNALHISFVHFFFNIFGILIWYPIPKIRKIPLVIAKHLGHLVIKYSWFGVFYILYTFVCVPITLFGISYLFNINTIGFVFGILLVISILFLSTFLFYKFDNFMLKLKAPNAKIEDNSNKGIESVVGISE